MIHNFDEYQAESAKTMKDMPKEEKDKYCVMKICEEAGEVASIIAKHYYHGKPLDIEHLKEELGDLNWYVANLAKANDLTFSEIATANIEKLRKRHGEKYNSEYYQ